MSEYYLLVDDNKEAIEVNLYRPNRVKELTLYHYNSADEELEKKTIEKDDKVSLTTYQDDYYVIESKYSNKKQDKLKVAAYHQSDIANNN